MTSFNRFTILMRLVSFFCFALVNATVTLQGCSGLAAYEAQFSINDAFAAVQNAVNVLNADPTLSNEVNKAAFLPLFNVADRQHVIDIFNAILALKTNNLRVTVYCTEDHVTLTPPDSKTADWQDTGFTNDATGQPIKPGVGMPQSAEKMIQVPRPKPGARSSYSILGFKSEILNADFSSQAHIYLNPSRFGQSSPQYDQRLYSSIIAAGLKPGFNHLDYIKPLAQTIIHEFTHLAGGTVSPTSPTKNIRDIGPGGIRPWYGWIKAEEAKRANDPTYPPTKIADSYTMLAQALYLQIKGKPTFWSSGAVDINTLQPIALPPRPARRLARTREIMI